MTWTPGTTTVKLDDERVLPWKAMHPDASFKKGQILFFGEIGKTQNARIATLDNETITLDGAIDPGLQLCAVVEEPQ